MAIRLWLCALAWLFLPGSTLAASLTVINDNQKNAFTRETLTRRPDARMITVPADPAYGHQRSEYQAIPLGALLQELGFHADDTLQFVALDGFVATLPARLVLPRPNASQAWLAIESADTPWPPLSPSNAQSAGPFYLIWTRPAQSGIRQEQWPYQISRIERVDSLEKRFPSLAPPANTPAASPVWLGFEVFKTQCSVCHRMNGGGEAQVGPDLNLPMNPTEYFQPKALRMLIRNPARVRTWVGSRMPAFSEQAISEAELDALIAYLDAMKSQRP